MKQASKTPRPFIKCSQYLKPVSVSVSAYLSIRNFKCLIAAGANHYSIPYNKGSYHSTILLREVTAVSNILTYSHFTQTGPARIYLIIMRPQLPFPWSHTLITHAVPVPVWETEHTYLFLSLFQCEHSTINTKENMVVAWKRSRLPFFYLTKMEIGQFNMFFFSLFVFWSVGKLLSRWCTDPTWSKSYLPTLSTDPIDFHPNYEEETGTLTPN